MLPRLDEIEADLLARRGRAEHEAWLGEVEGIDLTLTFLRQKRAETKRLARVAPVDLGMPALSTADSHASRNRSQRLSHTGSDPAYGPVKRPVPEKGPIFG